MAFTKVEVISNALAILGLSPITSLDSDVPIVQSASQAFDFKYGVELSTGQWRFATKIAELSLLVDVPPVRNWLYAYQLPFDFEKLIRLYPHNYAYELYNNKLMYSNIKQGSTTQTIGGISYTFVTPALEYQYQPVYTDVPNYFWGFFVYDLAKILALSNAHNVQYDQALGSERAVKHAQALAADAQNRPSTPLQSQPIITDRAVSTRLNG